MHNLQKIIIHCFLKRFAAITQHIGTEFHSENALVKLHSSQLQLKEEWSKNCDEREKLLPQLTMVYNKEAVAKSWDIVGTEICPVQYGCKCAWRFKGIVWCDKFPSSSTAESFHFGRTKLSYLIALDLYFRKKLCKDMENSDFTFIIYYLMRLAIMQEKKNSTFPSESSFQNFGHNSFWIFPRFWT